jgi:peptide/nickel transport system permease protein
VSGPYLLRRLGFAVAVMWAAFTVSFVVLYLLPGDPVATMAAGSSDGEPVTAAQLDALRARYGLDQPLPVQYLHKLGAALHGDLGTSSPPGRTSGVRSATRCRRRCSSRSADCCSPSCSARSSLSWRPTPAPGG